MKAIAVCRDCRAAPPTRTVRISMDVSVLLCDACTAQRMRLKTEDIVVTGPAPAARTPDENEYMADLVKEYLPEVEGGSLYGVRFEDMTREELMAAIGFVVFHESRLSDLLQTRPGAIPR